MSRFQVDPARADGLRVLIAGSIPKVDASTAFITGLVNALLEISPRTVILNGGRKGKVDEAVVAAFNAAVAKNAGIDRGRLWTFLARGEKRPTSDIPAENLHNDFPTRFARRVRMVELADVVVAVGGSTGTAQIVGVAQALEKPVIPLPFAGGKASNLFKYWDEEVRPTHAGDVDRPEHWRFGSSRSWTGETDQIETVIDLIRGAARIPCFLSESHHDPLSAQDADAVDRLARDAGFSVERQKAAGTVGSVHDDLHRRLRRAAITIAVVRDGRYLFREEGVDRGSPMETSVNANVAYEIGFSIGHGIPTLLITRHDVKVPFDIAALRSINSASEGWEASVVDTLNDFRRRR